MSDRPHVLLSCAMSVDGYIDDAGPTRLLLSNDEDFDRVDAQRAGCDAILVGANTIRRDDPRLLVRSPDRQRERADQGLPPHPIKVTMTASGDLDPSRRFFTTGDTDKLVYGSTGAVAGVRHRVGDAATAVDGGDPLDVSAILADLSARGVRRLMVEGGGTVHTRFLASGLVDELQLVVAPFLVGESDAPRFLNPAGFPWTAENPMTLAETRRIGDVVLLRYLLHSR